MVDDRLAIPRKSRSAPPPASPIRPRVPPGRRNNPIRNSERPRVVTITPATRRRVRIAAKPSSGRIAATGGIFAARRDGTITESMVIPMPTNAAMTIVRGRSTVWALGNPAPAASNNAISPCATSSPPTTPSTVATTPRANASSVIIRRTWRPEAPTARSNASSRRRWPMVIWNTLLMMNALTNAVMNANTRSPVPKMPTNSLTASAVSWADSSPVITSVCGGSTSAIARWTVGTSAPSTNWMSIASTLPSAPKLTSAVSRSSAVSWAPPKLSPVPRPTVAVIVPWNVPTSVRYETVSPIAKPSASAVALSMATSSGPFGGRPSLMVTPWSPSSPSHDTPNVGPPAGGNGLPVAVDELSEPLQDRFDDGDALDLSDRVGETDIDRVASIVAGEFLRRSDLEVDVLVQFLEQTLECCAQAVGEHERSDHERHARGDRERNRQGSAPSGTDALSSDQGSGTHVRQRSAGDR